MVIRPQKKEVIFKTKEQWHWFDCPRQLGTNSPDTPKANAVADQVDLEVGDVVLAMSDGVIDNLWEHEIVESIVQSITSWETGRSKIPQEERTGGRQGGMQVAAADLVEAARLIAMDPFAESPFMEKGIEEGLASEGGMSFRIATQHIYRMFTYIYSATLGKPDDISVVAALCVENR